MFRKINPIPALLFMTLLTTACVYNGNGKKNDNVKKKVPLKNTYWIAEEDDGELKRTVELIFNEDGSFHCRSLFSGIYDGPFYGHVDADSYTWIQNSDSVELEFATEKPHKKEIFYADILSKGDRMKCSDIFGLTEDDLIFKKQDKLPELTSIEKDSGKLIGEWELVAVGDYSPANIISDYGTPFESNLKIYTENEKMYADYHIVRWKKSGKNDLEQVGISLNNEPLYDGSLNEFWSASFDETVSPEDVSPKEKLNVRFTLVDDNELILTEEYMQGEDEHTEPVKFVYLRKDSKEYADRENYFYFNTVTVSNINELVKNLNKNTRIILKEGTYNFSDINEEGQLSDENDYYSQKNIENCLFYKSHIRLEAQEGAAVNILTESPNDNVLEFDGGSDISLKGLTIGHDVEKGDCMGNVLSFSSCDLVKIEDCYLFGCGTYGINTQEVSDLKVVNTQIYDCTYGLVDLNTTDSAVFKNCVLRDSAGFNQFNIAYCNDIRFEDCNITENKNDSLESPFISSRESSDIVFKNCKFKDNTYEIKNKEDVEFTDCEFDDNNL